jgi:pimeloyl-ACP methyl ester carboxylesterase
MCAGGQFRTRRVEANGIEYVLIDEGAGPAVLLLHGFPDTASLWRHQVPALVDAGFRAVAPDLRGRGRTQAPPRVEDYALPGMVPDLVALVDALGVDRAHIVGHDFGAALGWLLAALRPERVGHLVVLSVGHPATRERPTLEQLQKSWYQVLFQFEGVAEDLLRQDDWFLFREFLQGDGDVEDYVADLSRPGALTAALNWYRASFPVARLLAPAPKLPPVQAPTLGLWSTGDRYLPEYRMLRSADHVAGPWRYERIEDASHWIPLDQPKALNRLVAEFLPAPGAAGRRPGTTG